MKSSLVPPLVTPFATPAATARVRQDLQEANLELASGRHADLGLTLAGRSSLLISTRGQEVLFDSLKTGIDISATRLQVAQQSLQMASDGAQSLLKSLAPMLSGQVEPQQVAAHARSLLTEFVNAINATAQGSYVFGGMNLTEQPLMDYFAEPLSAARGAVEAAFATRFGFAPGDAAAASISAADMASFLDNDFAPLFDAVQWDVLWSQATDNGLRAPVGLDETVEATASANDPAMRKVAMAYVMVAGLGIEALNASARQELAERALATLGEGIAGIDRLRGDIGFRQERIERASERLQAQRNMVEKEIAGMEQVDLHAVAARVNDLALRLETSYTLTGRLQKLTLLNFL